MGILDQHRSTINHRLKLPKVPKLLKAPIGWKSLVLINHSAAYSTTSAPGRSSPAHGGTSRPAAAHCAPWTRAPGPWWGRSTWKGSEPTEKGRKMSRCRGKSGDFDGNSMNMDHFLRKYGKFTEVFWIGKFPGYIHRIRRWSNFARRVPSSPFSPPVRWLSLDCVSVPPPSRLLPFWLNSWTLHQSVYTETSHYIPLQSPCNPMFC